MTPEEIKAMRELREKARTWRLSACSSPDGACAIGDDSFADFASAHAAELEAARRERDEARAEAERLRSRISSMQAHEFVHAYECKYWRTGVTRHGPCSCAHNHLFESNPGMYDTLHQYCVICGIAE